RASSPDATPPVLASNTIKRKNGMPSFFGLSLRAGKRVANCPRAAPLWGICRRRYLPRNNDFFMSQLLNPLVKSAASFVVAACVLAGCGDAGANTVRVAGGAQDSAKNDSSSVAALKKKAVSCESGIPARFAKADPAHPGMIWIAGGTYNMGADNDQA